MQKIKRSVEKYYLTFGKNMSRLAKKPTKIPAGVEAKLENNILTIKGPKGSLSITVNPVIKVEITASEMIFTPTDAEGTTAKLLGTYPAHARNMIIGVTKGFEKELEVEGVGFKWDVKGTKIVLALGFSHPVEVEIPKDLKVEIDKLKMKISGIDKEKVGSFAAKIRDLKKPEPYKGKGIHYVGEYIRRKQGKKTV